MRAILLSFAVLVALVVSTACVPPSFTLRMTGIPWVSRNQVVVTCPNDVALLKIERIDQYGTQIFGCRPGESVGVRASGPYSDQAFVLVVYEYVAAGTNEKGEPLWRPTGRHASRPYQFYDNGVSGQVWSWDVQRSELR